MVIHLINPNTIFMSYNHFVISIIMFFTLLSKTNANIPLFKATQTHSFKENKGQIHDQNNHLRNDILFSGQSDELFFHLRNNGISYQLMKINSWKDKPVRNNHASSKIIDSFSIYRIDINWLEINKNISSVALNPIESYDRHYGSNYPAEGINVASYNNLYYNNIYPNINLHYYFKNNQLKYDYLVKPGGNYKSIKLEIKGALALNINKNGGLNIQTPFGEIVEEAPLSFQRGEKISSRWKLDGNILSFEVDNYDPRYELIIDPITRTWGTYSGGSADDSFSDLVLDSNSAIYVCGDTKSINNIATSGAYQTTHGGGFYDAVLMKYDLNGNKLWGTYIGDSDMEFGFGVCLDGTGNVFLSGTVFGSGTAIASAASHQSVCSVGPDAYLMKFSPSGSKIWGTYYGGSGADYSYGCKSDANGNIYIYGDTSTPTSTEIATASSHQTLFVSPGNNFNGMLAKFSNAGVRQWGTYYGGEAESIYDCMVDGQNNIIITGITSSSISSFISTSGAYQTTFGGSQDAFIAKFNSGGVRQWGSYFGDSNDDDGSSCIIDNNGDIILCGTTTSTAGISTPGCHQSNFSGGTGDGYLAKFNSTCSSLKWATYYGGNDWDYGTLLSVNPQNYIYFGGATKSSSAISTPQSYQPGYTGNFDCFLTKFAPNGLRLWGTYIGDSGADEPGSLLTTVNKEIYMVGNTTSSGTVFATSTSYQPNNNGLYDGFIEKFNDCTPYDPLNQTTSSLTCSGNSISLSASSSTSQINWYTSLTSTNSIGTGTTILTSSTLSAGTYTYYSAASVSICNEPSQRTPVVFQLLPSPTITAVSSETNIMCAGQTATLTANGANNYTWTPGGTGSSMVVSPTITTTYSIVGTNTVGCSNSANITQSVSTCAGINQPENSATLTTKLYPNPSSDGLIIIEAESESIIKMYNTLGQLVLVLKMSNTTSYVDVSSLTRGIYFVNVEGKSGENNFNKKLLIE